jgi:hypothetical protein
MGSKVIIFLFAVVFLFSGLLYAQQSSPESQPGYYVDKSAGEPVFKQRLAWDEEEYVLYYEVTIQIFSGQYREYRVEKTKNNYIEISLNPGRYRYRVTPYDLLERRGESSDWEEFTITTAFQPEITKIVPEFFYMDQNKSRVLLISGNNILADSDIYLRNENNELFPIEKIITGNTSVKLTFNDDTLIPGTYEVYIKNPGGLDTSLGGFFVGYQKWLETFIKVGFNPVIPIGGELMDIFGPYFYYPGLTLKVESLTSERSTFKAGMEFSLSFYYLHKDLSIRPISGEDYAFPNFGVFLTDFTINIPMQIRFNHLQNAVTFSLGFGITIFKGSDDGNYYENDMYNKYNNDQTNGHINFGVSGLFLVYGNFYIETGVDLTYYFTGASIFIKPKVSAVWKF